MSVSRLDLSVMPVLDGRGFALAISIDGADSMQRLGLIGLDPDHLLGRGTLLPPPNGSKAITLGRCGSCGEVGCDSVAVEIAGEGDTVVWRRSTTGHQPFPHERVVFQGVDYRNEIARARADRSWETPHRAAARMIAAFAEESELASWGMSFQWADAHDTSNHFTVCLRHVPGPYQVFVHFDEPGEDPHELTARVLGQLEAFPSHWPDVEWLELYDAPDWGPEIAGRGWRRRSRR